MLEIDLRQGQPDLKGGLAPPHDSLVAENVSLRLLLVQAEINAQGLLAQAGIVAKEHEASGKLQKLILEELHHRIKNTLATVSAIASQSLRNTTDTKLAQHAIEGRLQALGRAHDLLMQARWTSADLEKIVRAATAPFDDPDEPKISISGPEIQITSGAVIALAMTLNELCTNTTKFGAGSVSAGRVDISWTVDDEMQLLRLHWTERDGPVVHAPSSRSFGTRLIETLGKQLKGIVLLTYEPSGFVYKLDAPLTSLTPVAADR